MKKTSNARAEPERNVREYTGVSIRSMEGEGNERRFQVSFSSEEPYGRWSGPEILDHSDQAVNLSRLNEIGVLLFNHDTYAVMGKVVKTWIENNRGEAIVEFDTDDESEKIYQKVKNETLKGSSVRYSVENWEDVAAGAKSVDGRFNGPARIAKKWTPLEISIVSVPADPTVGVSREAEKHEPSCVLELYERQVFINKNY